MRDARDGERLDTLDGVERTLTPQTLVVAERRAALGLAGLMGGARARSTTRRTAIVLEAANFNGPRVRRTSMRPRIAQRGVVAAREVARAGAGGCRCGARGATALRTRRRRRTRPHAFGAPLEAAADPIALHALTSNACWARGCPPDRVAEHLRALGCDVTRDDAGDALGHRRRRGAAISPSPPISSKRSRAWRATTASKPSVPSVPPHEISSAAIARATLARTLASLGYREVVTHSLRGDGEGASVEVRNPLSEEQRFLRESLVPGLLEYLARVDAPVRAFEIGHVFRRDGEDVVERTMLAFGFSAEPFDDPPWHDSKFLRLKGDCEALLRAITGLHAETAHASADGFHPGKTASMAIEGRDVATLGCVDPRAAKAAGLKGNAYLCVIDVASLPPYRTPHYRPPSQFPSTYRDVALVVDAGVEAAALEKAIASAIGALCTGVRVFDEYRGSQVPGGHKSLAVRVSLQRFDATITDEEADAAVELALDAVRERFGATIRT